MGLELANVKIIGRDVPAQHAAFTIVGQTHYGAPITNLINKKHHITGTVEFAPAEHHTYTVRGVLKEGACSVWIEDDQDHQPIGQKFESQC